MKRLMAITILLIMGLPVTAADYRYLVSSLVISAITEDTAYILVDLSDTTNFRHKETNHLVVRQCQITTAVSAVDLFWQINVGVVVENSGTDGTAEYIVSAIDFASTSGMVGQTRTYEWPLNNGLNLPGLNLKVDITNKTLTYLETNNKLADNAAWQNDTARTTPAGTANPAVGDLIVYIDEIVNGGSFSAVVSCAYYSE